MHFRTPTIIENGSNGLRAAANGGDVLAKRLLEDSRTIEHDHPLFQATSQVCYS